MHGQYDINQIIDDALWLSKETGIDELSALRIVVQEWQTKSTAHLLSGFSEEETASLQDVATSNGFGTSFLGLQSSIPPATNVNNDPAVSTNHQSRLIELYLAERRYILKVCEWVLHAHIREIALATTSNAYGKHTGKGKDQSSWEAEVGRTILEADDSEGVPTPRLGKVMLDCIDALQNRVDELQKGSGYFKDEGGRVDVEEAWGENQILEAIHIMQLIFLLIDSSTEITPSNIILAWLRFTSRYGFFDQFALVSTSLQDVVAFADIVPQGVR